MFFGVQQNGAQLAQIRGLVKVRWCATKNIGPVRKCLRVRLIIKFVVGDDCGINGCELGGLQVVQHLTQPSDRIYEHALVVNKKQET